VFQGRSVEISAKEHNVLEVRSRAGHVSRAMLSRYSHCAHGSEAARPRRDRRAPVRGGRESQGGGRAAGPGCGTFSISRGSVIACTPSNGYALPSLLGAGGEQEES
jgi:hypothetical protein